MKARWHLGAPGARVDAETRDRTGGLQIFGVTLSQLSYRGLVRRRNPFHEKLWTQAQQSTPQIPSVA